MNKLRLIITLFTLVLSSQLFSQNSDRQMEKILEERRAFNQSLTDVEGFRIQIFSELSESRARGAQSKFNSLFPEVSSYLSYEQPEWKVQVGNFKEKLDAYRILEKVRMEFPGALILKTKIKI